MRTPSRLRLHPIACLPAVLLAVLPVLAACSSAVAGNGTTGTPRTSSASPDFPSGATTNPGRTSGAPASASTPARSPLPPTLSARSRALAAQAGGARVLVRVPGGYEAATYDQAGHVGFWHNPQASTSWRQVGNSRYPYVSDLGPPHALMQGALLSTMAHATFIVRGTFTGDSSGNAVAFTTGRSGWGAIKAERNGNIGSSGQPVGSNQIGLGYDFGFVGGRLQTKDCPTNRPISDCDTYPVVKLWQWAGHDFRQA